jgi:hypothetical protein
MEPIKPSSGGAHYARFGRENKQKDGKITPFAETI